MTEQDVQHRLSMVRQSAAARGYACTLTAANIRLLMAETHCQYTGKPFTPDDPLTFERVDNSKGYIPGNVIPVCKSANELKSNSDIKGLAITKSKILSRHNGHYGSVNAQILNRKKKIISKVEYIRSHEKMLEKLRMELAEAEAELERVRNLQDYDSQMARTVDQIVLVLKTRPDVAEKYLSTWQRVRTRLVQLRNLPRALNISQIFARQSTNPYEG